MASCLSQQLLSSLRFQFLQNQHHHSYRVSLEKMVSSVPSLDYRTSSNRSVVAVFASHGNLKHSDFEEEKDTLKTGSKESQEAWEEVLASFKDQALKMQSLSQEAYEVYLKKAMVTLNETSKQLKIPTDRTRHDLQVVVNEISEHGHEYVSSAMDQSPKPVKDIVETFASSTDALKDISKVRDFCLGIPYGASLSLGGFLSFAFTGSISAVRFGVILGGTLLALSLSSLRSQKRGESFHLAVNGQAAIACILFLRELRLLFLRTSIAGCFATLISGAMVAFYMYRITSNWKLTGGSNLEHSTEA